MGLGNKPEEEEKKQPAAVEVSTVSARQRRHARTANTRNKSGMNRSQTQQVHSSAPQINDSNDDFVNILRQLEGADQSEDDFVD